MEILALILSVLALIVSTAVAMWGWQRNRNIYDIERDLFFRQNETDESNHNFELRTKLRSGKYTILHTGQYGGYIEVILGKLKK